MITPDWKGFPAVIIAGGESFTSAQARLIGMARALDAVRVIAINDAIYPCWFADIAYACDARWWRHHNGLPGFPGRKMRLRHRIEDDDITGVEAIETSGTTGFDPDPNFLRTGGNSGFQAVHLAAHLHASTVLLVGYDMQGRHWFGDHPAGIRSTTPRFNTRIEQFIELADALPKRMSVINVTPNSLLSGFRRGDLRKELERILAATGHPALF